MSPRWLLFSDNGPSAAKTPGSGKGGGLGPYGPMLATEFAWVTNTNAQIITGGSTHELYDGNGTGDVVGIDLPDRDNMWIVWASASYTVNSQAGDPGAATQLSVLEGTGASTTDNPAGVVTLGMTATDQGVTNWAQCHQRPNTQRPTATEDAEWGLQMLTLLSSRAELNFGGLWALPISGGADVPIGPHLGTRDNYWGQIQGGNLSFAGIGADEDVIQTSTFTAARTAKVMAWCEVRHIDTVTSQRTHRWYHTLNSEDIFNVRSDNTAAGSTNPGRGFSYHDESSSSVTMTSFAMVDLVEGTNTYGIVGNKLQADVQGDQLQRNILYYINPDVFSQNCWVSRETAEVWGVGQTDQRSFFDPIVISIEGDAPVWINFTIVGHNALNRFVVDIKRNSTVIVSNGTSSPGSIRFPGMSGDVNNSVADNVAKDSDAQHLPTSFGWIDNPGPGLHTYEILVTPLSDDMVVGARDDGSDGAKNFFAVTELRVTEKGTLLGE